MVLRHLYIHIFIKRKLISYAIIRYFNSKKKKNQSEVELGIKVEHQSNQAALAYTVVQDHKNDNQAENMQNDLKN